jgi:hypothetical protein
MSSFTFRRVVTEHNVSQDPESLFRDLKSGSSKVQFLWSHQADILRTYMEHKDKSDIALELPTGCGKTLVGLLIGEFRRRSNGERVVYLCPTRQLAYQVGSLAEEYGINCNVFVGPQKDYPQNEYSNYTMGRTIAITTYSGLFNTNPRINDPQVIILDDAHASENYIASMWSLKISRNEQKDLFFGILHLFADGIQEHLIDILEGDLDTYLMDRPELIPIPYFIPIIPSLREYLDNALTTETTDLNYRWSCIREHLHACNMFFSRDEILIRPIIPPSLTHQPFESANQRVYMSATLGDGGELERITGVREIHRIPVPAGWDRQGSGRRLILFPDKALNQQQVFSNAMTLVKKLPRTLILCPNGIIRDNVEEYLDRELPEFQIISSHEIEVSLEPFICNEKVVLLLAGRYDGIDLPGDSCRLLIIWGLPNATNLQERFLWDRLKALPVLWERTKTRLTQALGRCTRHPRDFAIALIIGQEALDFCARSEKLATLHPELRAEMIFGLDNSDQLVEPGAISVLADIFLEQGKEWMDVDADIIELREKKLDNDSCNTLVDTSKDEVDFLYSLWLQDWDSALEKAKSICDSLSGDEVRGYRAWWYYQAGSVAWISNYKKLAKDYYQRALKCTKSVSWLAELVRLADASSIMPKGEITLTTQAEQIADKLNKIGLSGGKFERVIKDLECKIGDDSSSQFEQGLAIMGEFLGFCSMRYGKGDSAPDVIWWTLNKEFCIVFEAKRNEDENGGISTSKLRQSRGHIDWAMSRLSPPEEAEILSVIVGHKQKVNSDATPFTEGLFHVQINELRELNKKVIQTLRYVRAKSVPEQLVDLLYDRLQGERITVNDIIAFMKKTKVQELPTA